MLVVSLMMHFIAVSLLLCCFVHTNAWADGGVASVDARVSDLAHLSAAEIMAESLQRHELYPYVYEEQTLVLVDEQQHYSVRRMQRYSRLEHDGNFKTLLKFTYPLDIAGASLLFVRLQDGEHSSRFYLPAFGMQAMQFIGGTGSSQLLGSEFLSEDLMPEDMHAFVYRRLDDMDVDDSLYFVLQAFSAANSMVTHRYTSRRLLIRQDNFFVTSIDYFDADQQLLKRQTRHDIHPVTGMMWRADMMMVENFINHHRSILKIDGRVFSKDYVPNSIFSPVGIKDTGLSESSSHSIAQPMKPSAGQKAMQ